MGKNKMIGISIEVYMSANYRDVLAEVNSRMGKTKKERKHNRVITLNHNEKKAREGNTGKGRKGERREKRKKRKRDSTSNRLQREQMKMMTTMKS